MKQLLITILAFAAVVHFYWPGSERIRKTRVIYRNAAATRVGRTGRLLTLLGALIFLLCGVLLPVRQALSWPTWSFYLVFVVTISSAVIAVVGMALVGYSDAKQKLEHSRSTQHEKQPRRHTPTA